MTYVRDPMGQPRRVAVVIVNYRTPELTQDAVASLAGEIDPDCDAVVVVDNASDDGSAERLEGWLAEHGFARWARLVRAPGNRGFAAGNNLGLRAVDAELYLLLNSDAQLRPGALAALLAAASARPELGPARAAHRRRRRGAPDERLPLPLAARRADPLGRHRPADAPRAPLGRAPAARRRGRRARAG